VLKMAESQTSARCPSDVMLRSIRQTGAHSGVFERIEIDHAGIGTLGQLGQQRVVQPLSPGRERY